MNIRGGVFWLQKGLLSLFNLINSLKCVRGNRAERQKKLMSCTGVWKKTAAFKQLAAGILKTPTAPFI